MRIINLWVNDAIGHKRSMRIQAPHATMPSQTLLAVSDMHACCKNPFCSVHNHMNVLICQKPLAFKQARKTSLTMLAELKVQLEKKAAASAQLQLP
jgi:hypothetical protein